MYPFHHPRASLHTFRTLRLSSLRSSGNLFDKSQLPARQGSFRSSPTCETHSSLNVLLYIRGPVCEWSSPIVQNHLCSTSFVTPIVAYLLNPGEGRLMGVALGQVPRPSAIFYATLYHPPRHTDIANTQAKMNRGNAGKRDGACMTPPYGLQDMDMKMW